MFEVNEEMDPVFCITNLPEELIIIIFGYLKKEDLCRVGRVCKKWYAMSRDQILWKRVDVHISKNSPEAICRLESTMKFLKMLPPCVTQLKIDFDFYGKSSSDALLEFRTRCPNLQVLNFYETPFSFGSNFFQFLPVDIKVLAIHYGCIDISEKHADSSISKIEVLDISYSEWLAYNWQIQSLFMQMPLLRELHFAGCDKVPNVTIDFFDNLRCIMSQLEVLDLEDTKMCSITFQIILNYGFNLTELYVCRTLLLSKDIRTMFNGTTTFFPHLKTICLRFCHVTYNTITTLIKSCPSLQHVYVGDIRNDPIYDYTKCNSLKVHINESNKPCHHFQKIDYMRK